jgi:hypothetical protein
MGPPAVLGPGSTDTFGGQALAESPSLLIHPGVGARLTVCSQPPLILGLHSPTLGDRQGVGRTVSRRHALIGTHTMDASNWI